jgi:hypothetical protein
MFESGDVTHVNSVSLKETAKLVFKGEGWYANSEVWGKDFVFGRGHPFCVKTRPLLVIFYKIKWSSNLHNPLSST